MNVAMPASSVSAFEIYYNFLSERGRFFNLTSIEGLRDVIKLHFLDSISLLKIADFEGKRVIDIGSGAGFPGLPLKIAQPRIDITLLDANQKRVSFLSELCGILEIEASCVHARAEDAVRKIEMREQFDIALSRAVARLNILCELCIPFIRVGGVFLAMKSLASDGEIKEAEKAIDILGAEVAEVYDYLIPETERWHRVVIIMKKASTPDEYPRRFARIQKKGL